MAHACKLLSTYNFPENTVHYRWDNALQPQLRVNPGDSVVFKMREVSDGQITAKSQAEDLSKMNFDMIYPLCGPVYVEGANVGDTLQIEILDLIPGDWGWTGFLPGLGLLSEDFPYAYINHWDLSDKESTVFRPGINLPLDPFCGTMGVAPKEVGSFNVLPPGNFGGNMDIRHLTAGTTLLLPVLNKGALFSCGDCHSAQGDGEVCVTGIESPMQSTLRFNVIRNKTIPCPQFITRGPLTKKNDSEGYYVTTGVAPDLMISAQDSVRNMINHLSSEYKLSKEESYILCSVAADLKISEVVDKPNWIVSCYIPLSIFSNKE
jgi:acetamidase/formamidase